jgi:hypothetical protein
MTDKKYAFLIYSSTLDSENYNSYYYGFGVHFFRIVGDKPFGRGDVVEILNCEQRTKSEFRIDVRVLGDPMPRYSVRQFDPATRIELPTLIFLSSRIYLSPFSDYKIEKEFNCEVLTFQQTQQDSNKIYAVALLATGTECRVVCREPTTKVCFEWVVSSRDDMESPKDLARV